MGLVNLKEMAKRLKRTEEEVMTYVDSGIIKPPAYCHPCHFGDGKAIAFYPEQVLAQVEAKKKEPEIEVEEEKVVEPVPEQEEEPEPEQPSEQTEGEGKDPFEQAGKEKANKDKTKK